MSADMTIKTTGTVVAHDHVGSFNLGDLRRIIRAVEDFPDDAVVRSSLGEDPDDAYPSLIDLMIIEA